MLHFRSIETDTLVILILLLAVNSLYRAQFQPFNDVLLQYSSATNILKKDLMHQLSSSQTSTSHPPKMFATQLIIIGYIWNYDVHFLSHASRGGTSYEGKPKCPWKSTLQNEPVLHIFNGPLIKSIQHWSDWSGNTDCAKPC